MKNAVAELASAVSRVPARYVVAGKVLLVLCCLLFVGWPQLDSSLAAALRYKGVTVADYSNLPTWIDSADCLRRLGVWAAHCKGGQLTPLHADDPGHAILLGLWARVADRPMDLVDVTRQILMTNAFGLIVLAGSLLALGSFWAALFVLYFGPYVFLEWFGTSPHWALIGVTSMQVALPLGLIARARGLGRPGAATALIVVGFFTLALGSLLREAIASMTLVIVFMVLAWTALRDRRHPYRLVGLAALAAMTVVAAQSGRLATAARDIAFAMDTRDSIDTHGMSHNLFMGLGTIDNKFGIRWDDDTALEFARTVAPDVRFYSRQYYQIMWQLYLEKWRQDPAEAARVYVDKLRTILSDRILDSAPPLWLFLTLVVAIHWFTHGRRLSCGSVRCDERLAISLVALGFTGMFVAQAVLAHPSRLYAAPAGAFILVLAGVSIENLGAWVLRFARPRG